MKHTHSKKIYLKILVDIIMTVMFICLTKIKITGMHMHEVLGIIVTLFVAVHLALNFPWVKNITLKIFDKNLNNKTRRMYIINSILAVLVFIVFVSGILVSVTVLTNISVANRRIWALIHKRGAALLFILLIGHILLNLKMIKSHCKKICNFYK